MTWKDRVFWMGLSALVAVITGVISSGIIGFVHVQRDRAVENRQMIADHRRELKALVENAQKEAEWANHRIDFLERLQETD